MVTRAEVMDRAVHGWGMACVPYSQVTLHQPDGYRQDCSGYVSMCWMISTGWGGESTVTLVTGGFMSEIPADDLLSGDAVALAGPGTAGDDGHIILFSAWLNQDPNDSRFYGYEQAGGTVGPRYRLFDWPDGYRAYRYRGITDAPSVPDTTTAKEASPMMLLKDRTGATIVLTDWRTTLTPVLADCQALKAAGVPYAEVSNGLVALALSLPRPGAPK